MENHDPPIALDTATVPQRAISSSYPAPFNRRMVGREKQVLGDLFGLQNFGVNRTKLAPKAMSALRHAHRQQDEFIYILQGHPTLYSNAGTTVLAPGMCAGFRAGSDDAHHLVNETESDVIYLEIGDRSADDRVVYPDDDLQAVSVNGQWLFQHRDGTPYASVEEPIDKEKP